MPIPDDPLEKLAAEAVASAQSLDLKLDDAVAAARKALEQDSLVSALQAAQAVSISSDIEEMQRRFQSIEAPSLAVALRDLESPVMTAARAQAHSQRALTEAARSASQIEAERMAQLQASAASDFADKFAAVEAFDGVAKRFAEMQATLGHSVSSKLFEASRSVANQWSATVTKSLDLFQNRMTEAAEAAQAELERFSTRQASLDNGVLKNLAAIESFDRDFTRRLSDMEAALGQGLSRRFLEASASLESSFNTSTAKAALAFSQTLPLFDERIAEAMREFTALGDLQAGAATISAVGTVMGRAGTVSAAGEAQAAHSDRLSPSAIELWWARQPIQIKVFFLVLLFILKSMSEEIIHERVKDWTGTHSLEERQLVYDHITQNLGDNTARRLRCIRASTLKVRSEPSAAGTILDSLPRGTPVEVLESQGSWSRIRHRVPHSSDIREGWAASGYLSFEIC